MESSAEAIEMRRQLTELGDKANFHIRKWISNHCDVVEDIPKEDELPITKTLGMSWTVSDDQCSCQTSCAIYNYKVQSWQDVVSQSTYSFIALHLIG